jgi:hypothetical protein
VYARLRQAIVEGSSQEFRWQLTYVSSVRGLLSEKVTGAPLAPFFTTSQNVASHESPTYDPQEFV